MKLIIKSEGVTLLRPSRRTHKLGDGSSGRLDWQEQTVDGPARALFPRSIKVSCGAHEAELVDNPFVPGGEQWVVLRGSRIGAAVSYLRRMGGAIEIEGL